MFTIFSLPKPFLNPHIKTIQRNAIKSWATLGDEVEIFLLGKDEGIKEMADEFSLRHFPDVKTNEYGTPLLDSAFQIARINSKNDYLFFINSDIIFLKDINILRSNMPKKKFLILGRRYDLEVKEEIDYTTDWKSKLIKKVKDNGILHRPEGSDYFIFPKNHFRDIPEFAVGRVGWDNWMIYNAVKKGFKTIDASQAITIVHQNHDYSHQLLKKVDKKNDPEAVKNRELTLKAGYLFCDETEWIMEKDGTLRKRLYIKKARLRRKLAGIMHWLSACLRNCLKKF